MIEGAVFRGSSFLKKKDMIKKYILCLGLCIGMFMSQAQREYTAFDKAFHSVSSNEIMEFVYEMCKPEHKGLLAGSPIYRCALGLELFLLRGRHGRVTVLFSEFSVQYTDVKDAGVLKVKGEDMDVTYRMPDDYYPGTHTASGVLKGEPVYVGFGITAPDLGYDDYAGIDVRGKIVVIEPGVPCERENQAYARWDEFYSGSVYKIKNAVGHGAAGALFTGKFSHPGILYNDGFIYCHVSDKVVNDLLTGTSWTARTLKDKIRGDKRPHSMVLTGKEVEMMFRSFHAPSQTQNVIGYIPGTDKRLKDAPIIIGAHLDHLGCAGYSLPRGFGQCFG